MAKYKFEQQREKLDGICDENKLVYHFGVIKYPITLTIKPNNGVGEQLSMLEQAEERGYINPGSYIRFSIDDGALEYEIGGRFPIDDALFSKIKRIFIRMHTFYLEYFFKDIIDRKALSQSSFPPIKNDGVYNGKPPEDEGDGDDGEDQSDAGEEYTDEEEGDGLQPLYTYEPAEPEGA